MTSTPHDALFKAIFKRPEHARAELESVLPASLAQALDWRTIRHLPGSFVDPKLAEHHTDLLFSVKVREGGEALLYLLEHQSTSDRHMALRLLGYLVRIWETWCEQQKDPTSRLPVIVPVVFYHAERRWAAPVSFDALVEVPESMVEEVRPYIPSFRYVVDDLSDVGDEALRRRALTGLGLLVTVCLRDVRARDAVEAMKPWVADLQTCCARGLDPMTCCTCFDIFMR